MKQKKQTYEVGNIVNFGSAKGLLITAKSEVAKGKFNYKLRKANDPKVKYMYTYEGGLIKLS